MLVQIVWFPLDADWEWWRLLGIDGDRLLLQGADYPDGTGTHSGDTDWYDVADVRSMTFHSEVSGQMQADERIQPFTAAEFENLIALIGQNKAVTDAICEKLLEPHVLVAVLMQLSRGLRGTVEGLRGAFSHELSSCSDDIGTEMLCAASALRGVAASLERDPNFWI